MHYKAFAAITLIAAPIIVLAVQGIAPHAPVQPSAAPSAVLPSPVQAPPVVQPAPMPVPAAPEPDAAAFGQPMPDAGKPFLSPGNGLPAVAAPAAGASGDGAVEATSDSTPS
ncbi:MULTISPECIES: hypothetical protein [Sphingobium]|uniref:Uncharacterized protein n=1 Tax=Sphingobium tyrosinilyticum TaxID=2715436 RepID=A0ABV9EXL5_9SPHN|nr:hypothetical protein [Sphingobium sp. EP60837]ANI77193.1 hypothetical protein EP837_00755 [Sphingobium sp. EP60837]